MNSEIFLLDSNILMSVYRLFGIDTAPHFWDAIKEKIENCEIVILDLVKEEINSGNDGLVGWINSIPKDRIYNHKTTEIMQCYAQIMRDLENREEYNQTALDSWSPEKCADPWIIDTAWARNFTIVTNETLKNPKAGSPVAKAKIPTVASKHNVKTITLSQMMKLTGLIWN